VRRRACTAYACSGRAEQEVPASLLLVAGNARRLHAIALERPGDCTSKRCQKRKEDKAEERTVRSGRRLPEDLRAVRVRRRRDYRGVKRRPARRELLPLSADDVALHTGCIRGDDGGSQRVYT
jgi:hypothetical protein